MVGKGRIFTLVATQSPKMRTLTLHLLVSALIILTPEAARAQRDRDTYNPNNQVFEVFGQVTLAENRKPLAEIVVRLERFAGGAIDQMSTDSRGRFRFANLQRGFYKVVISANGYNPVQQEADLTVLFRQYLVFELTVDRSASGASPGVADVVNANVPPEAREQFVQGRAALAKKNYSEGISHLEKAVFVYSGFFEAQLLLATAFIDTREWAKAETALHQALELKPDNAAVMISLGEVYWREKRFSEAEEILLAGLKLDDKSWQGQFTLGRLYWEMGSIAKAGPPIGRTLQLKPELAEAHLVAGNILLRVSQQQRALAEYQEYLRLSPHGEFAAETREIVQKLQKALAGNE